MKIVVSSPYKKEAVAQVLKIINKSGITVYKGRNTIKTIERDHENWNVKIFKLPHIVNKIAYRFFRKSKAQRSFEYANKLIEMGFLTPKPIAYVEVKTNFFLLDSFYISEALNYDLTFRELINDTNYPDRVTILQQFTKFTYNLHVNDIYFIDHSPGNTLIIKQKKGNYHFYLVDLNRMKFGHLNYQKRIQNFARLSLTDDMIEIIALEYAGLCNKDYEEVYADMLNACHISAEKRLKKAALKKSMGL